MRKKTLTSILVILAVALSTSLAWAATIDGTVKLGGIILDEEGDRSAVQETFNIHDGFSVTQVLLNGRLTPRQYFSVNLREANLDSRQGSFYYRMPGMLKVTARYDQHTQVYDADRAVESERKDLHVGIDVTPLKPAGVDASMNHQTREGDRLSFPAGTTSNLGDGYDYTLITGRFGVEAIKDRRGVAVAYRFSDFTDDLAGSKDRQGQVVSARAHAPCFFYDKWTHLLRGSYGKQELTNSTLDYELTSFAYTGVVRPVNVFQFKYNFDAQRVDNKSTDLQTDRFQNNVDLSYFHEMGRIYGGYGYEVNDDDRTLTSYNSWRFGLSLRLDKYVKIRSHYAGRVKKDQEELTLLKDVESSRFRGDVEVTPVDWVALGGGYNVRQREYPDIEVRADGSVARGWARVEYQDWGSASGEYSYALDEYENLTDDFEAETQIVTTQVNFEKVQDLRLSGGVTYVEVGKDLDIQKYFFFLEGMYTVLDDYHLEVKYNRYEYDDFILLDRYYTADVVWFNLAYDLHFE